MATQQRLVPRIAALVCLLLAATVLPGIAAPARASESDRATYIIVLGDRAGDPRSVADEHAHRYGADVQYVYRNAMRGYAAAMSPTAADAIRHDARVRFVTEAAPIEPLGQVTPTGVDRIEADLGSQAAGNGTGAVAGQAVAVLDTGIDVNNPDLNVAGGVACYPGTKATPWDDDDGHGTQVASVLGARDDDEGIVGVAPGVPMYAVTIGGIGGGTTPSLICGLEWVAANATSLGIRVANISFGVKESVDQGGCGTPNGDALHLAVCNVVDKGVTVVAAAGNDGADLQGMAPAEYDEVLAVTATIDTDGKPGGLGAGCYQLGGGYYRDDTAAPFSNWAQPGSADEAHTIAAPGCVTTDVPGGGTSTYSTGTSFASPHAAGAIVDCIASGACTGTPADIIAKVRADAKARAASYGFVGDPNHLTVCTGSGKHKTCTSYAAIYTGYLVYAGAY